MLTRGCMPQKGATSIGWTKLHDAAEQGNLKVVKQLLEAGVDIDAKDTVSERSVGYGGLGVRTSRDFGES